MTLGRPGSFQRLACAALGLLLANAPLPAQDNPNTARGASTAPSLSVGDVDSVNLFNGNLSLGFPLGQTYPVGAGISYGFRLSYNSNVWRLEERSDPGCQPEPCGGIEALPDPDFNAGLGWQLHFGQIRLRDGVWSYTTPDGGQVRFYNSLHDGETEQPGWLYSRDGSYLRLHQVSATKLTIDFPDGRSAEFTKDTSVVDDPVYYLTRLRDSFGNGFDVVFQTNAWKITDTLGRIHYVDFVAGTNRRQVQALRLKAFNGQEARWDFTYSTQTICRSGLDTFAANSLNLSVPLLTGITGPDSLEVWSMPAYATGNSACGDDSQVVTGVLERLVVPTQGALSWAWGWWGFWSSGALGTYSRNLGVLSRTVEDPFFPQTGTGTWSYQPLPPNSTYPMELGRDVIDPSGHTVRNFFATPREMNDTTFRGWEYGLPFSPHRVDGGDPENPETSRYLSRQVYRGSVASNRLLRNYYVRYTHDKLPPVLSPDRQRGFDRWYNTNRRVELEREVYVRENQDSAPEDATKYWRGRTWSDFDGLSHYRASQTETNFPSSVPRTDRTQYNPSSGCYDIALESNVQLCTGASQFVPIPTTSAWLLGRFSYQSQDEGATTTRQDFQFRTTGLLDCTRVRVASGGESATDLVTRYGYDAAGSRISEVFLGGDRHSIPAGASGTCATATPGSVPLESYSLAHTYSSGTRASTRHLFSAQADEASAISHKDLDLTIDFSTGLPSASRDVSGLSTNFTYDKLSRQTKATPQGTAETALAWSQVTYSPAVAATPATATVSSCAPGTTSCSVLAQSEFRYDGWGRPSRERILRHDGLWSERFSEYDAQGALTAQSTWELAGGSTTWTLYSQFDAFHRPRLITPPDGTSHAIDIDYLGDRETTRFVPVATSLGGTSETSFYTTESFDDRGRLVLVQQQLDTQSHTQRTTYAYAIGGQLASVNQAKVSQSADDNQDRAFSYDARGFLLSEKHPEEGAAGNGQVLYSSYDARGHAHWKRDGGSGWDTELLYDSAERLRTIRKAEDDLPLKRWEYDTGLGYGLGKVGTARSWTYIWTGADTVVEAEEVYSYQGRGGLPSQRHTVAHINNSNWDQFEQYFNWGPLGTLAAESAPTWSFGPASPVTTWYGRTNGFLTALVVERSGAFSQYGSLTYRTNLTRGTVAHLNGVSDLYKLDDFNLQRPKRIQTTGIVGSPNFDSGLFKYDGAGNVAAIGSDLYRYDGFSRLLEGSLSVGGTPRNQQFKYDSFANITRITTDGVQVNTPTESSTNRLSGSTSYDASGNLTSYNGTTYVYDRLNRLVRITHPGVSAPEDWLFAFTADDERIVAFNLTGESANLFRWTIRGLDGKVRREFRGGAATPDVYVDYYYMDNLLLAADFRTGPGTRETRHFSLDHLGTPRVVTSATGTKLGEHEYFPYGQEVTTGGTLEALRFTGHERDFLASGGSQPAADDVDYMHARTHSLIAARFLSVDPAGARPTRPQSWNRYSYGLGNPLRWVDIDGRTVVPPLDTRVRSALQQLRSTALGRKAYEVLDKAQGEYRIERLVTPPEEAATSLRVKREVTLGKFLPSHETRPAGVRWVSGGTILLDFGLLDLTRVGPYARAASKDSALLSHELGHALDYEGLEDKSDWWKLDYQTDQEPEADAFRDAFLRDLHHRDAKKEMNLLGPGLGMPGGRICTSTGVCW